MKYYILLPLVLIPLFVGCATTRLEPPPQARATKLSMLTTGYCPCKKCCGWHRNWYGKPVVNGSHRRKQIGVTASGAKARPGTIAADISKYPFGTVMYIPGYGYGRVEDRGSAIQGEHIDLYFKKHRRALAWGSQKKPVVVYLPQSRLAEAPGH
ncbi:MAG: 3D domain-containing protein [Candidatus Hydrogenedentes bacterium]|nr:3D domain-containing protein [Candidatus Hydrogenedentota bacterium]